MGPEQELIAEVIQRIVDAVQPIRIVLFGSAARGTMRTDSDIDVLVVVPEGVHRRRCAQAIHRNLFGFAWPVDVVVSTPLHLERNKDSIGLIYREILHEGKVVYGN